MATSFGIDATSLAEPRGAGSTPTQGVMTPHTQYTLPSGLLDVSLQAVRDVRVREEERLKQANAQEGNRILADYTRLRTDIASSNLSLSEKNARMNALDSQFQIAATERGLLDDFKKARDLLTSGGITGQVASEEKRLRDKYDADVTFLRSNNVVVPPGASPEYVQALLDNHARVENQLKEYTTSQTMLEDARSGVRFNQEQQDRMIKEKASQAINNIAGVNLQSFNLQAKAISDQVLSGQKTEEEARADLIALQAQHVGIINNLSSNAPQEAGVWRTQYEGIINGHLDIITNRATAGQRTIDRNIGLAALMTGQNNPELLQIASLNPYLGENTMASVLASNASASRIILEMVGNDYQGSRIRGTNIVGSTDNKTAEITSYGFIRQGIAQVQAGTQGQEAADGYFQATNNVLTMLGAKNPGDLSATDLKDVAGFMLSPEFVYVVKNGGLNPSAASAASRVFKQVYGEAIDGEVREALMRPLPKIGGEGLGGRSIYPEGVQNYADIVDVKFQDGRVQFIPKLGMEETTAQGNTEAINRYIRGNLRDQEKALNQNLKLAAHLEGTTDYQKFWEDNKSALMPYMFADPDAPAPRHTYNGQEWEYIGPPGGNTKDRNNWRPVSGGSTE